MDFGSVILSGNNLTESLPSRVFQSRCLAILALSRSNFSGQLLKNIGNASGMMVFVLFGNKFSGQIPMSISNIFLLVYLDLSRNNFSGESSLLDIHDNEIIRNFEDIPSQILNLQVLSLRNNLIQGFIPRMISNLISPQILDLSGNNLTGSIPSEIGSLERMIRSIHRRFHLPGRSIETLDFSHNGISGSIPQSLTKLKELTILDVSYNKLTGKPVGGQMSTMNELNYYANSGLCGMQIRIKC
ncbi:hypothetical protein OSB04_010511 [Centaurea solstitialis]|uniref:Uncharacterized protein n=1 Tax=Centaurea solstitialis TaxID=347529 RepID=A0AA38TQU0_9ASTR|nr:hypothetical protein OSB04_010511 [Centaurea solstitialis]